MNQFILVGDIGGTKMTLAIFEKDKGPNEFIKKKTYKSKNHNSLNSLLEIFLESVDFSISHASFSVAGPVIEGQTILPNLQWDIMEYVTSGNPEESVLYKWLIGDGVPVMPPSGKLPDETLQFFPTG